MLIDRDACDEGNRFPEGLLLYGAVLKLIVNSISFIVLQLEWAGPYICSAVV